MNNIEELLPWERKAHRLIGDMCRASYNSANRLPNGKLRKRHVPYSVPDDAAELIRCLEAHDEERAKHMFNMLAFRSGSHA